MAQSPSVRPASAASSRNDVSEQAAVRVTRAAAVLIRVVIAVASFVLWSSSLWNLAARSAWQARLAWLWPVIVDGTIVLATMAIVALGAWAARVGPDLGSVLAPEGVEELRSRIETATIGLCLAIDRIDADLRRLVEYLNRATHDGIAVTALQLAVRAAQRLRTSHPVHLRRRDRIREGRPGSRRSDRWTRESFVDALERPR
jgi:hypothetical protein